MSLLHEVTAVIAAVPATLTILVQITELKNLNGTKLQTCKKTSVTNQHDTIFLLTYCLPVVLERQLNEQPFGASCAPSFDPT